MENVKNRLKEKKIELEITDEAKELLAIEGYDPHYGARPLKRFIENTLETDIAKKIISGEIHDGSDVIVKANKEKLIIESR